MIGLAIYETMARRINSHDTENQIIEDAKHLLNNYCRIALLSWSVVFI